MESTTVLERGMMLRDLRARALDARSVQASDFRGRRNLLLIFPGAAGEEADLLHELRHSAAELQEEEAVVLLADTSDDRDNFYGARTADNERIAALYITDRYGEIYFSAHPGRGESLPGADETLGWLRFINAQCPE